MRTFEEIYRIAVERHGKDGVEKALTRPKSMAELVKMPEDRWLAVAARCIFQAGFVWRVIEAKWDGFEEAFHGFDVDWNAGMSEAQFDALVADTRIVRNAAKIASVRDNALFFRELRAEGGVAQVIGSWPGDYVDLLEMLGKRGSRLGGMSGQYFLRFSGVESFILSTDVVARLVAEGVVDKTPTSKKAMKSVQKAFDTWKAESGRSLTEISRVLALSV